MSLPHQLLMFPGPPAAVVWLPRPAGYQMRLAFAADDYRTTGDAVIEDKSTKYAHAAYAR